MKRFRAFTLIELLVVISIVSLLVAILLPALSEARQAGLRVQCLAQVRSSGQAMAMYAADNREIIAKSDLGRANSTFLAFGNSIGNDRPIPDENKIINHGSWAMNDYGSTDMFFCPAANVIVEYSTTYQTFKTRYKTINAETIRTGGLSGGGIWGPRNMTTYVFNQTLVPNPLVGENPISPMKSSPSKSGTRLDQMEGFWPVLHDYRTSLFSEVISCHKSRGYSVLRADTGAVFLGVQQIVDGANEPGISVPGIAANTSGRLPEDPRADDAAWNREFQRVEPNVGLWPVLYGALK